MEAKAVALLDQSVKAYAQTRALSQEVAWDYAFGEETNVGQGSWQWSRPGRARLERTVGERKLLVVGTGEKVFGQWGETVELLQGEAIAETGEILFGSGLSPLGLMMRGINPLRFDVGLGWKSATVTPDGQGVVLVAQPDEAEPPLTTRISFDAQTHLITRAAYEGRTPASPDEPSQPYGGAVTLTARPATFAPDAFDFALPADKTLESLAPPQRYDPKLEVGARPFPLVGQTLDGKTVSLDNYKGKVVLLDFWATWCGPCIEELPTMRATYRKYHDQGFEILGISRDETAEILKEFVAKRDVPWPQVFDDGVGDVPNAANYGVKGIPFTLLIGKDGTIAAKDLRRWHLPLAVEKVLAAPTP